MKKIHIDIISDIACPWCAIGYARLETALEQLRSEFEFTIEWRAFELDPSHTGPGKPILAALAKKYGRSEDEMQENQRQMMIIAKDLGINFEKLQERLTCNTFNAHRLVKWAAVHGKQTALKQALFEAYFGKAMNVAEQRVLLDCVAAIGLDKEGAKDILDSDRYAAEVREEEHRYQQAGVSSVPAYVINNKYLISGAQEATSLVQAIRNMSEEL